MNGRTIINKVIEYIEKTREILPEVTDDMLCGRRPCISNKIRYENEIWCCGDY